jgi:hypothetical protein
MGVSIEEPEWCELKTIKDYEQAITKTLNPKIIQIAVVVLFRKEQK